MPERITIGLEKWREYAIMRERNGVKVESFTVPTDL
jgi:hypothetical protein